MIRIQADIPAGEIDVTIPMHLTIAESGIGGLREALVAGANRVLRAYGVEGNVE